MTDSDDDVRQRHADRRMETMIESERADFAALANLLVERDVEPNHAPAMLCAMAGYIIGRAVLVGAMTEAEADETVNGLASEIQMAIEQELDTERFGTKSWAQWPDDRPAGHDDEESP